MAFGESMRRSSPFRLLLVIATGLAPLGRFATADDLPPQAPPAYAAVYKSTFRAKTEPGTDVWSIATADTVTIAVSGTRSRWDYESDGHGLLNDYGTKTLVEFGGRHGEGKGLRLTHRTLPIRWEIGYGPVTLATEAPPEVLGTDTVAGQPCTRLKYDSVQFGTPEYCVAKNGIVLRFANRSSDAEMTYEAVSILPAPDPKRFELPAGLEITDRQLTGPRR